MNTNIPITQIAEQVGFKNSSYFIKCFNEYEKITPKLFRDKYQVLTTHRWDIKD
ncbi:AraC family transcriptional regulator [Metabacillus halosaccharovorans]|uniref:AraC family transcriptional regulator n=1 Tax=Metabacillus halosaccharovorans TaxID=930124 RepID=UPI0035582733